MLRFPFEIVEALAIPLVVLSSIGALSLVPVLCACFGHWNTACSVAWSFFFELRIKNGKQFGKT